MLPLRYNALKHYSRTLVRVIGHKLYSQAVELIHKHETLFIQKIHKTF